MKVKNYYELIPKGTGLRNPGFKKHGLQLPLQALIVGQTGSGKTNILMEFLSLSTTSFQRIVICVKNADEPLYRLLEKQSDQIEFYENGDIPDMDSFEEFKCSLIVFDDLVLENKHVQNKIAEYFIRGRKLGISCIYITQSFYKTPKVIRINVRYIFIKKLSSVKDLKLILSEFNLDTDLNNLLKIYNDSVSGDFTNFLLIDTRDNIFHQNFISSI